MSLCYSPPLHFTWFLASLPVHLFITATARPRHRERTGNAYEFSPSTARMVETEGSTILLQTAGARTRALDRHLSLTSHYLQSGWMVHLAKATYKLGGIQTPVTAWKCRPNGSFSRTFWEERSPCGESMSHTALE